jgi:hypothetical protein
MQGRLPIAILDNKKFGAQSADWFSRMSRARADLRRTLDRLSANPDVSSMVDMGLLREILDDWPDSEPRAGSAQALRLTLDLPLAIGAAMFIQNITGHNLEE